jgi:hypothetical protein
MNKSNLSPLMYVSFCCNKIDLTSNERCTVQYKHHYSTSVGHILLGPGETNPEAIVFVCPNMVLINKSTHCYVKYNRSGGKPPRSTPSTIWAIDLHCWGSLLRPEILNPSPRGTITLWLCCDQRLGARASPVVTCGVCKCFKTRSGSLQNSMSRVWCIEL